MRSVEAELLNSSHNEWKHGILLIPRLILILWSCNFATILKQTEEAVCCNVSGNDQLPQAKKKLRSSMLPFD